MKLHFSDTSWSHHKYSKYVQMPGDKDYWGCVCLCQAAHFVRIGGPVACNCADNPQKLLAEVSGKHPFPYFHNLSLQFIVFESVFS